MDGPTEGSQGPSGSRLRSTRWSSHRIRLTTWLVLIAVALGVLAFAIAAQIDRSQFTYRVRTVVNPVGTCWRVGVDVDAKDRKSTRLNSSHDQISYAVFCLKKKKKPHHNLRIRRLRRYDNCHHRRVAHYRHSVELT